MRNLRLSWIPDDVFDPQGMRWHPFGIMSRRAEGKSAMAPFELTLYWRRHYVHIVNPLHPACLRIIRQSGFRAWLWWWKRVVSWGRD